MNILVLNLILYTAEKNVIPKMVSIKDTMIYNMCLGFKKLGHNVVLAAATDYMPTKKEEYDFEVIWFETRLTKIFPPAVLPYCCALKKYLKKYHDKYDFILSSEVFSFNSLFATRICPYKTFIWQELSYHQSKFHKIPSKIWYNIVAKLFMRKVALIVPRSHSAANFIRKYIPNISEIIIDHGINVDKFKYSTVKKHQLISSSQLIYRKNVDGIIRKFARFHEIEGYRDYHLIIAGRGEEEDNLRALVYSLHLQDSIDFVGFIPQVQLNDYIRTSCAFLVNTRKDLNMVSIPESIVSGTPILTNLQPSSADYINENGLGIAKDDWNEMDIKEIIDNNKKYVSNCIAYRTNLTNTHCAKLFVDLFEKIVQ